MTLNHLHIGTKDLTKSRGFYEDFFGFKFDFDHDPGVFLRNDAGFLLAIDPVDEVPKMPSWYHLGFCLDSSAKVVALHDKMDSAGVTICRKMMSKEGAYASFFCLDPDGNKIEISWHAS